MHKLNSRRQGFTIVELLIVIVVIAILAAIAIVAYTNIQARAKVAKKQSEVVQISRKLDAYIALHDKIPYVWYEFGTVGYPGGGDIVLKDGEELDVVGDLRQNMLFCYYGHEANLCENNEIVHPGTAGASSTDMYLVFTYPTSLRYAIVYWDDQEGYWKHRSAPGDDIGGVYSGSFGDESPCDDPAFTHTTCRIRWTP